MHLIGPEPSNMSEIGGLNYADLGALLLERSRIEIRQFTYAASTASQVVNFANALRFSITGNIRVFLIRNHAAVPVSNDTFAVDNVTATGFTVYRNTGSSDYANARTVTYLAIEWAN